MLLVVECCIRLWHKIKKFYQDITVKYADMSKVNNLGNFCHRKSKDLLFKGIPNE